MILIDTNVWIEFFKQTTEFVEEIAPLLKQKLVVTTEPIFAELLYGVRNEKDKQKVEMYWNYLPKIEIDNSFMINAAHFANENNYHNLGIGLMDAIIIKGAMENNCRIWTMNKKIIKNLESNFIYK